MIRTALVTGLLGAALNVAAQAPHSFDPIAEVLQHPRCLNCHTFTEYPTQSRKMVDPISGEVSYLRFRHAQRVIRGEKGFGAPTLQCGACHQDENVADGKVPGAPHWHLAPLSMGWEGLNRGELCETLKDTDKNGGRDLAALVKHMEEDALVLWGWTPGGDRDTPPYAHADFIDLLKLWVAEGAPCPTN